MHHDDTSSAVDAYVAFLTRKQLDARLIAQRQQVARKIARHLLDKPHTREVYAETLQRLMPKPQHQAWLYDVTVAREFFPFWMQDIKAIASLSEFYGLDIQNMPWRPLPTTLGALTKALAEAYFSEDESRQLEQYMQQMKQAGMTREATLLRLKLAKILLLRLRDAPFVNHLVYRIAVDITLLVFRHKNTRQLFLEVVRAFFPFWIGADHKK